MHFTQKTNPLNRADLDEFSEFNRPGKRQLRKPKREANEAPVGGHSTTRSLGRDKVNLDNLWLKDNSLEDFDDLAEPHVLAQEIADDLLMALEQFQRLPREFGYDSGPRE